MQALFGFAPFLPHEKSLLTEAPPPFPDPDWGIETSEEVRAVLTTLLLKDPARRLTSEALLLHAWASPAAHLKLDALFGSEIAERVREDLMQMQEEQQLLAVDLLASASVARYSFYLLYWYTIANTDAGEALLAASSSDATRPVTHTQQPSPRCCLAPSRTVCTKITSTQYLMYH